MARKKRPVSFEKERTVLAEEQTILSKERTILSYMRTGLTFVVAGIAVNNFFPNIATQIVGWILIFIGFFEIIESYRRLAKYKKKMEKVKRALGNRAV